MLIPTAPEKVALRFCRPPGDLLHPSEPAPLIVEVVDAATGATVNLASLHGTAAWLEAQGYRYLPGTQAVWGRA